jgi:DNA-directed RNA polymerase specialized sigma24 family protein
LRHYDSLSLDDIADVLNLDTGTVKAHLFRALAKLREELKDLYASRRDSAARGSFEGEGTL